MNEPNTTGCNGEAVATSVGLAGGDLYQRIVGLGTVTPTSWSEEQFAYYTKGFLDARTAAAEEVARSVVPGWTDKPAGPGCYWVRNWVRWIPTMNYRIVEIFEIPAGGWNRGGRYLGAGMWVHEHGREWPQLLESSFGENGKPWDQLAFMLIPTPNFPEPRDQCSRPKPTAHQMAEAMSASPE